MLDLRVTYGFDVHIQRAHATILSTYSNSVFAVCVGPSNRVFNVIFLVTQTNAAGAAKRAFDTQRRRVPISQFSVANISFSIP